MDYSFFKGGLFLHVPSVGVLKKLPVEASLYGHTWLEYPLGKMSKEVPNG